MKALLAKLLLGLHPVSDAAIQAVRPLLRNMVIAFLHDELDRLGIDPAVLADLTRAVRSPGPGPGPASLYVPGRGPVGFPVAPDRIDDDEAT